MFVFDQRCLGVSLDVGVVEEAPMTFSLDLVHLNEVCKRGAIPSPWSINNGENSLTLKVCTIVYNWVDDRRQSMV